MRYVVAVFFAFFAAVHGGWEKTPYVPGTPSFWNQAPGRSWLLNGLGLSPEAIKPIASLLWLLPMAGFLAASLAVLGWWVPHTWWKPLVLGSAGGSVLLAVLFWHPWQWASALVDVAIILIVLFTDWLTRLVH